MCRWENRTARPGRPKLVLQSATAATSCDRFLVAEVSQVALVPVGRNTHCGPASSRQVCILNHARCNQSVVAKGDGNPPSAISAAVRICLRCSSMILIAPSSRFGRIRKFQLPPVPRSRFPIFLGMHADLPLSAPVRTHPSRSSCVSPYFDSCGAVPWSGPVEACRLIPTTARLLDWMRKRLFSCFVALSH